MTSAAVPELVRPANPRPVQPARGAEVLLALAVIAAIALLIGTGFMLGRMQRRRDARSRIKRREYKARIDSRRMGNQRRNLRLISPKRR